MSEHIYMLHPCILLDKLLYFIATNRMIRFDIRYIYELPVQDLKSTTISPISVTFRRITYDDLNTFDSYLGYDKDDIIFSKDRLLNGDIGIVAIHDNVAIGYMWIMNNLMEITDKFYINLPNSKAYIYKVFVSKNFRGKRVAALLNAAICDTLNTINKKTCLTWASYRNSASIKAKLRVGFRRIGLIYKLGIYSYNFSYVSSALTKYIRNN